MKPTPFVRATALAAATLLVALPAPGAAAADKVKVVKLRTRGDVVQRFIVITPADPVAAVILFPGGSGKVPVGKLKKGGLTDSGNFLVRSRYRFAAAGLVTAVVDRPSDEPSGMDAMFRSGEHHAADIAAVVEDLKRRAGLPVWLVGTSAGTESAASVGVRLQDRIAGVVLTSSVTEETARHFSVLDLGIEKLAVPVLVVAHRTDACFVTPPGGANRIMEALSASRRKRLLYFEGGDPPRSDPCQALSAHGFLGIEDDVVEAIAEFIKEGG